MKRIFSTLAIAITAATAAMAQSAQEGISYFLPKTGVQIALRIEKTTFTPGKLAPYSDIYFKKPAETQPSVSYRIVGISCNTMAVPDKDKKFEITVDKKHSIVNVDCDKNGVIMAINAKGQPVKERTPFKAAPQPAPLHAEDYMSQDILSSGNMPTMARMVAQEIYDIRDSRNQLSRGESGSIQTQRMMLRQYAEEHGLTVVGEYIDDGWSGTNFDRPGFQRMIDDIEEGKINCVVTKDLSRLGRNYILTGQYTEIYFPSKGVRYIAVNDNVDTLNGESELAPFLNILNEMHARQTSKKVKAAMRTRFANGAHYGAYAPLGYIKDPDKSGHLLVDPETKWIIEKIFDLAVHGHGAASITHILVDEKVPTPGWLNFQRYGTFANIYAGASEEKSYAWTVAQVKSILKEETYIGHSVHNKQSNISFKNKKKVRKPQEEWYRVENTHEAIISADVFRQVQEQIAHRRRKQKDGTTQIFSGLVKCADCGWSMAYGMNKQNKKPYGYYHCSKNGQGLHQCSMHYIRYDVLYTYILARVQYWSQQAQQDGDKLLQRLLNASDKERNTAKKKQTAELKKATKRKAEVDNLFAKMYEDWSVGRITEYNFNMLSEKYQAEQHELDEKIQELQAELDAAVQTAVDAEKWIELMKKYVNPTQLTAELLNALIEKILIHEAVKHEDGTREQEVEIFYRFIGKVE